MFREWFRTSYPKLWEEYLENSPSSLYPLAEWVEDNYPEIWTKYKLDRVPGLVLQRLIKGEEIKINGILYINREVSGIENDIDFSKMTIKELIDLSLQITYSELERIVWS